MKTRYISCLTALLLSVGMFSCNRDDAGGGPVDPEGPVGVRIVVSNGDATRSVGSEATDNEIRRLRVYAFNKESGELTGYAMSDNLQGRNYLPITLSEDGDTYFYVIANDHFGPKPMVGDTLVSDWTSLTPSDLQNLVFDLSNIETTGWESISPMSNNRYREDGSEFTNKYEYENDFATPVYVEDRQIIPVTVQHVLGRLQLFLYKDASLGDDYVIKLTRAAVYRRPDAFRLYYSDGNTITYTKNSDALVDEFVTSEIILDKKPANGETPLEPPRTFLAPNIYGSGDKVGSAPASDEDKAYKLVLTIDRAYRGGGWSSKDYTVYLPPVSRNASIDVQGTISAEVDSLSFNVMTNAWVEKEMNIPPFQ